MPLASDINPLRHHAIPPPSPRGRGRAIPDVESCSNSTVLKEPDYFFLLRTALKDRPKGPPTANRQLPPTTNCTNCQPPTATNRQLPTAANCQRRPTANRQPPTTANRHQPPITNHQPPPTTTNRQLPTANRQSPPTANRQPPPTKVEHMECPQDFLPKTV